MFGGDWLWSVRSSVRARENSSGSLVRFVELLDPAANARTLIPALALLALAVAVITLLAYFD